MHPPATPKRGVPMGMTMTQKILAAHAGLSKVVAGQLIEAAVDLTLANDVTAPLAIRVMRESGFDRVFDREKVCLVMDHFTPNKDIKSAEGCKLCREFARSHDLENYFDVGTMGIEHALLPERGLVGAGDLVVGAVAAIREYQPPMAIVDMGTATTITVLDKEGAFVGGFLLGLVECIVTMFIPVGLKDAFSFVLMIIVIIFLPGGVLSAKIFTRGNSATEKV